jgi:hypothetical protein
LTDVAFVWCGVVWCGVTCCGWCEQWKDSVMDYYVLRSSGSGSGSSSNPAPAAAAAGGGGSGSGAEKELVRRARAVLEANALRQVRAALLARGDRYKAVAVRTHRTAPHVSLCASPAGVRSLRFDTSAHVCASVLCCAVLCCAVLWMCCALPFPPPDHTRSTTRRTTPCCAACAWTR